MTIGFIPIDLYSSLFQGAVLVACLVVLAQLLLVETSGHPQGTVMRLSGPAILVLVIAYMGLRPIDREFVDMTVYARMYASVQSGLPPQTDLDPAFRWLLSATAPWMSVAGFFFLCALLYVVPLYLASRTWFGTRRYLGFLMMIGSFTFWPYGVNGIRSGIASSFFILGLSRERRWQQVAFVVVAALVHLSFLLPAVGLLLSYVVRRPSFFLFGWIGCLFASFLAGSTFQTIFAQLWSFDDRGSYLLMAADQTLFRYVGFRWDFLAISLVGVGAGWYFIRVRGFVDPTYARIYSVFLFSNALWLLVIGASFSNRFAYLSWFLQALVVIYPLLRQRLFARQNIAIGAALFVNAGFALALGAL